MRRVSTTAIVAGMLLLAACSGGHGKKATSTTTQPGAGAPSTSLPASTGTGASPSTTSSGATTTTRPGGSGSNVRITVFDYVGDSPVTCNAPTQAELKWSTSGATSVALYVDGALLARYPNGNHDDLFALPCDGNAHTYELKATAPGVEASRSLTISTKQR